MRAKVAASFAFAVVSSLWASAAHAWTASTGATWSGALNWSLNRNGSASIPTFSTVEQILLDSYDAWTAPSCSAFSYVYNGSSSRVSSNNGDNVTVHGFLNSWPSSYGDRYSVIGITLAIYSGSRMIEADVSFNEDIYTFIQGAPSPFTYEADLQSIATHEFGHSLGLGHTNVNGATMTPYYDNGTAQRSIASDDSTGLCALYPGGGGTGTGGGGGGGGGTPAPADDSYEDNDDIGAAALVSCGDVIQGSANDADWYVVQTTATGVISASLTWSDGSADLDLYLADASPAFIAASEATQGTSEAVSMRAQPAGDYFFLVNNYAGGDDYTLTITCPAGGGGGGAPPPTGISDDGYEENDNGETPTVVDCPGTYEAVAADQDWFAFELPATGRITARIGWSDPAVDLDLYLVDTTAVLESSELEDVAEETVAMRDLPAGTYGVVVNPYEGAIAYTLTLTCTVPETPADTPEGETGGAGGGTGGGAGGGGSDTSDEGPLAGCACNQGERGWTWGWAWAAVPLLVRRRRARGA